MSVANTINNNISNNYINRTFYKGIIIGISITLICLLLIDLIFITTSKLSILNDHTTSTDTQYIIPNNNNKHSNKINEKEWITYNRSLKFQNHRIPSIRIPGDGIITPMEPSRTQGNVIEPSNSMKNKLTSWLTNTHLLSISTKTTVNNSILQTDGI